MKPIYNYLLAYSYHHPNQLVVGSAYIKAHRSGLPPFMSPLITDHFLEQSGLQSHLVLYGRAVSDHSKTIVIDGLSKTPLAFVGSKNLTDASGAVCFDDVIQVSGPAASLVLDDYYEDMTASLKYEMDKKYVTHLAQKGWSKDLFQVGQDFNSQIANILKPFDLLDRDEFGNATIKTKIVVSAQGNAQVRTGMINWNSSRSNAIDEVLQMIFLAQKNIYISDQFLFDRNIVLALLKAKENNPDLDIKIILEPLEAALPQGMPNLLYLDVLESAGIEIKKKLVRGSPIINQEYHLKTLSMDGLSVIAGSANKDQSTMYGAFREEQLEVWDKEATAIHDQVFMSRWNNLTLEDKTENFNPYDFVVPAGLKGFDGTPLSPKDFLHLLREIVSILFDANKL
jgi:phosphatidylserine/phosphatidylglycerophosphate/cardiolipin synthase-like enzyme